MSELNGKQLAYAALHQDIFVLGVGNVNKTLSAVDNGLHKGVKMTIDNPFIVCEMRTQGNKKKTVLLPISSFAVMVLAD